MRGGNREHKLIPCWIYTNSELDALLTKRTNISIQVLRWTKNPFFILCTRGSLCELMTLLRFNLYHSFCMNAINFIRTPSSLHFFSHYVHYQIIVLHKEITWQIRNMIIRDINGEMLRVVTNVFEPRNIPHS
ncbi:hypothetical protein BDR07DRAFT_1097829 [Suillus spraguei]|nr:hypothetical protein BDR07DRAFT_1097829 [Suillus spraguei]